MPPKRATRAETKTAATYTNQRRTTKRASSPENAPPSKRTRATPKQELDASEHLLITRNNNKATPKPAFTKDAQVGRKPAAQKKPASKPAPVKKEKAKEPEKRKAPAMPREHRPYLNSLPSPPEHTRPANQIFVWGAGNFGQFGMGPDHLGEFDKPKKNTWVETKIQEGAFGGDNAGIEAVVAGGLHTMFIDETGTIWTCGVNDDAALGRVTKDVPNREEEGAFLNVDVLTAFPHPLQTLVEENFRAVSMAAGDSICAAVSSEGELRVWGSFRGNEGALGFSDGSKYQFLPSSILQLSSRDAEKVVSVAAGNNHLVVLTTSGNIYTWGAGEQGQLGRKIIERRKIHGTHPEKAALHSRSRKATVVGAGNYTSFAVDNEGTVWGWGLNNMGQTGTGFRSEENDSQVLQPLEVIGLSREDLGGDTIAQIVGGEHHTLFLTSSGRVFACGRSNGGQLGLPDAHPAFHDSENPGMVAEPTLVPFPVADGDAVDPVVHISAGTHNNMAVTASGALFTWGEGNQGELGIGDDTDAKTPTMIVRRQGGSWKAIAAACGGQHSIGLFRKKTVD